MVYPSIYLLQAEALLGGRQPVWLHPSFREEVLGQSLVHEAQPSAPELTAVLGSMALTVAQLQSLRGAGGASPALAAAAAAVHESFRQSLAACQHMVPRVKPTEPQPMAKETRGSDPSAYIVLHACAVLRYHWLAKRAA